MNPNSQPQPPVPPQRPAQPPHAFAVPEEDANTVLRSGLPPQPATPAGGGDRKTLAIVLGSVAAVVALALVAVFVWIIPAFSGGPTAVPAASSAPSPAQDSAGESRPTSSAAPSGSGYADMPAGATPLPEYWRTLTGPDDAPQSGDKTFSRFVTGESSFARLSAWSKDPKLGITTDPETGDEMQKAAAGTDELDGDGLSMAFSFFAESEGHKYGSDPERIKGLIATLQAKLTAMGPEEMGRTLVGHKCASGLTTTKPDTREFLRGLAVVVGFQCQTSRGEAIQGVNLFTVTPWGTPQILGVSGHQSYWDQHPGLMAKLANSYRINKWVLPGG
ncbi:MULTISPECIES: hypothetical protein [Arthrobacter]|uniref:Uncharacterized protein n=2 Tax=Arthrobacter TaxID=1663 RepID=A0ABU9KHZ0_9MICC|nr:hypothetical protein [Arthrobacter sp. YJM1]MDP5226474.1 hypothetical protein [Arthrobacter sp. YJM1]